MFNCISRLVWIFHGNYDGKRGIFSPSLQVQYILGLVLLTPCFASRFLAIGGELVSTGCRRPLVACGGSREITLKIAQTKIHGDYNYAMAA